MTSLVLLRTLPWLVRYIQQTFHIINCVLEEPFDPASIDHSLSYE